MNQLDYKYNDANCSKALDQFKGNVIRDCFCRSIAIVSGQSYRRVYYELLGRQKNFLNARNVDEWNFINTIPRNRIYKRVYEEYIDELGGIWVNTLRFGHSKDRHVYLRAEDLPGGKLIVRLSHRTTAVINHVIYDTYNPSKYGKKWVYGYYIM